MAPGGPVGGSEVRRAGRLVAEFIKLKAVLPGSDGSSRTSWWT